ncbi:hypothetical protein proCM3_gp33 [Bacillus phage proCM3]|nr:hypothetical protein proCM3_gp33 [Bacillus phage proCM3]
MTLLLIVEEKYSSNGFNRPFKDRSNTYDLSIWLSTLKGKDKTVVHPHQQGVYNNEQNLVSPSQRYLNEVWR